VVKHLVAGRKIHHFTSLGLAEIKQVPGQFMPPGLMYMQQYRFDTDNTPLFPATRAASFIPLHSRTTFQGALLRHMINSDSPVCF